MEEKICPWRWESIVTASRHVTPEFAKEIDCIREKCAKWGRIGEEYELPNEALSTYPHIGLPEIKIVYGCRRR